MTRWLKLWLVLFAFIATGWGSATATPYLDPGYAKLNADHVIQVDRYERRYNFWRWWMRRDRKRYRRRHRDEDNYREYGRHKRSDEVYDERTRSGDDRVTKRRRKPRKNGSRFWGGPYWGYGARLSHPCERCRVNCEGGKRGPYCRRCRARCGW